MRRILIVEDDVLLSGTLAYNLRAEGYEVVQAFSCAEARLAVQADVVLLDVICRMAMGARSVRICGGLCGSFSRRTIRSRTCSQATQLAGQIM